MKIELGNDAPRVKSIGQLLVGETFRYGNSDDVYLKARLDSIFLTNNKEDGCVVINLTQNAVKVWASDIKVRSFPVKVIEDHK